AHVLFIQKERVPVVSFVLAECLSVIAKDYKERLLIQSACAQALDQRAQCGVGVVQGVQITIALGVFQERAGLRAVVWMMTGNRKISQEESLIAWERVYPLERSAHRGVVVYAEARLIISV